ncbi:MAG: hypothetical protein OEX81_01410 [Candidatus Pacebacteria bacterium]|nr:hypothetical protein [Candidatus Paceibacterota bacterium]
MNIETLRSFKIGPFAVFDFAISYLIVYLIAPLLVKISKKIKFPISKTQWLWLVVPFSVLSHIISGEMTPLTKMFINRDGDILVKVIVLFMLYMGIRRPKKLSKKK